MPAQLPFFIAACDYTLMGEELYAASAYLSKEPLMLGSLKGQDLIKIVLVGCIVIGVIFEVLQIGNGFFTRLFLEQWPASGQGRSSAPPFKGPNVELGYDEDAISGSHRFSFRIHHGGGLFCPGEEPGEFQPEPSNLRDHRRGIHPASGDRQYPAGQHPGGEKKG